VGVAPFVWRCREPRCRTYGRPRDGSCELKAYFINLDRSADRRRYQQRQLERLGIDYALVPGVDGRELSSDELVDTLPPGIVGCARGHLNAYRQVLADGEPVALVLEDDAALPQETPALLRALAPVLSGAEVALLHYRANKSCPLVERDGIALSDGFRLLYPVSPEPLSAATAYVMTAEACRRMSEFVEPVRYWPDDWKAFLKDGALDRLRCVSPRPVQAETSFKSTVGYADGLLSRVVPASIRAWRRARIQRHYTDFPVLPEAPPGATAPDG
jgi:glycosyl transferase family 25